jgi:hypothetical protein
MKHKSLPALWMGTAFGVALVLATTVLALKGIDPNSLRIALRLTARWSFVLFWVAYTGGAMAALFGPALALLARRGREFGLSYAAAQLIHLGLVVWLVLITSWPPLSGQSLVFFFTGIVWTYLLAVLSFGSLAEGLGPSGWRILRTTGLNYILFAFASDFVPPAIRPWAAQHGTWGLVAYLPFAAMSVAAPLLVLAAAVRRRVGTRYRGVEQVAVVD